MAGSATALVAALVLVGTRMRDVAARGAVTDCMEMQLAHAVAEMGGRMAARVASWAASFHSGGSAMAMASETAMASEGAMALALLATAVDWLVTAVGALAWQVVVDCPTAAALPVVVLVGGAVLVATRALGTVVGILARATMAMVAYWAMEIMEVKVRVELAEVAGAVAMVAKAVKVGEVMEELVEALLAMVGPTDEVTVAEMEMERWEGVGSMVAVADERARRS